MQILNIIRELLTRALLVLRRNMGAGGHRHITSSTTPPTPENYYYFKALEDSSVTYVNKEGGESPTGRSILAGDEVFGLFTTLTVVSGEVRAYIV